ncbi:unnamed protein product [Caenorhabditis bovis]|uniref:Uncharacterized protein n=1 Tax=Caenorhabditis bovis TaxID=2654633 RepID=A0A8S1EGT6_9PELO|nr:unnamed protein product [Caenorhabditis bovis]
MYQLEPVLGTTASSYFYPSQNSDAKIPEGIVKKRRQIFVEPSPDVFHTPTASSAEGSLTKHYPITRVTPADSFSSTTKQKPNLTAHVRIIPPPPSSKKAIHETPKRECLDIVRFGITAPSELVRGGPIWINSGPKPPEADGVASTTTSSRIANLWRPSNPVRRHVITRFHRNDDELPSLTINVQTRNDENDNESELSCRTDWRYYESKRLRVTSVEQKLNLTMTARPQTEAIRLFAIIQPFL